MHNRVNIAILQYMDKKFKKSGSGKEIMVPRLIHLEPSVWDFYSEQGRKNGTTRSTEIRLDLKRQRTGLQSQPGVEVEV